MLKRVLSHLTGQTGVFAINAIVGLLIVRLLPPSEYALVVIAFFLQVAACVLSDLGLSHVLISKLSNSSSTQFSESLITRAAILQKNQFAYLAVPLVVILGLILLREKVDNSLELILIILLSVLTGLYQSTLNLVKATLNSHHNDRALLRIGLVESILRIILLPLFFYFPVAVAAIAVNFFAAFAVTTVFARLASSQPQVKEQSYEAIRVELRTDVAPLAPGAIYALFQGQIAILLLGLVGHPQMVAEAGALGRLAQVVNLLLVLNPFWVQPYFSRFTTKAEVLHGLKKLTLGVFCIASLIWGSVVWVPDWWLLIIGDNYAHASTALQVSMAGVVVHAIFAVSYTVAVARGLGAGQHWAISLSIFLQLIFLATLGVHSVEDALVLQLLPALGGFLVQWILIGRYLISRERPIDAHN